MVFSGAQVPDLSSGDVLTTLFLLHAGPLLVWIGYEAVMRWMPRRRLAAAHDHAAPSWLPPAVFLVCVSATIFSLVRR